MGGKTQNFRNRNIDELILITTILFSTGIFLTFATIYNNCHNRKKERLETAQIAS